jgi:hypothetical protein
LGRWISEGARGRLEGGVWGIGERRCYSLAGHLSAIVSFVIITHHSAVPWIVHLLCRPRLSRRRRAWRRSGRPAVAVDLGESQTDRCRRWASPYFARFNLNSIHLRTGVCPNMRAVTGVKINLAGCRGAGCLSRCWKPARAGPLLTQLSWPRLRRRCNTLYLARWNVRDLLVAVDQKAARRRAHYPGVCESAVFCRNLKGLRTI